MKLKSFKKGIHPYEGKALSKDLPIQIMNASATMVFPLPTSPSIKRFILFSLAKSFKHSSTAFFWSIVSKKGKEFRKVSNFSSSYSLFNPFILVFFIFKKTI